MRLWGNVIGTVVRVANEHDRLWQQRRRVLNTLLVTLFVFRLVFSKDRQGYATTVAEQGVPSAPFGVPSIWNAPTESWSATN